MKKLVSVLVLTLFAVNYLHAQTTETLTNSTIIKMVKAKLSDDLILDQITSSRVKFNVSADSIKYLSDENVSDRVIQAMKTASGTQTLPAETTITSPQPVTVVVKDTMNPSAPEKPALTVKEIIPSPPVIVQSNDSLKNPVIEPMKSETLPAQELQNGNIKTEISNSKPAEESAITVNAVSYVIPLEELMIFFDNEFKTLTGVIQEWDKQIRNSLEKGNQINEKIRQVQKELTDKKNSDSRSFTNEIIMLKKKLSEYRENNKQFENSMITDGLKIIKEIGNIGSELDQSINKKFSEISQKVRKPEPEPSANEIPKSISIPRQKINNDLVNYIAPVTEVLFFCQNEIITLRDIILLWNTKVIAINKKDSELIKQLEPLTKELTDLQLNPKVNKEKISALKKQSANIDKERKLLVRQMGTDSKELSGYLTQISKEVQSSVKERLSDIIENIKYSYQDNFTYRDI